MKKNIKKQQNRGNETNKIPKKKTDKNSPKIIFSLASKFQSYIFAISKKNNKPTRRPANLYKFICSRNKISVKNIQDS